MTASFEAAYACVQRRTPVRDVPVIRVRYRCPLCGKARAQDVAQGCVSLMLGCPCGWSLSTTWVRLRVEREPLVWEGED